MAQYYDEEYLIEECKNSLYNLFKNNVYLNDMWFIFLDYYEININATKYKALPIIITFITMLFIQLILFYIIFYVMVMYIKYYANRSNTLKYRERHYIAKLFPRTTKTPHTSISIAKIFT